MATRRSAQAGFSLIEVLVTVVVLAIGLLGLAGLQINGLRYTHSAYFRSQATILAEDILDRMRANRAAAEAGNYIIGIGTSPGTASCEGTSANCTSDQMAGADLYEWKQVLSKTLPQGNGSVARQGDGFRVVVQWDDSRGADAAQTLAVESVL
jgi:type IV pilus assembly protein PilV